MLPLLFLQAGIKISQLKLCRSIEHSNLKDCEANYEASQCCCFCFLFGQICTVWRTTVTFVGSGWRVGRGA